MKHNHDNMPEAVGPRLGAPAGAPTRRAFARAVLAGLLGLLGVTLVRRSQVCARSGACDGCALYVACTLPQKQERP